MNNLQRLCDDRIKKMINIDKSNNPKKVVRVIKSEVMGVIKNYLSLKEDNIYIDIIVNSEGKYELRLKAIADGIKMVKSFI